MFAVMNKKWWKRGLILGAIVIIGFLYLEVFYWDYIGMKRFVKDKNATIENFVKHEDIFNQIYILSKRSPHFDLSISETDSVSLLLNFENNKHFGYYEFHNSQKIIIDTFSNQKNWTISTTDSIIFLTQGYGKKHFSQFEEIYQLTKQINGIRISNNKDVRLNIDYKTIFSNGFRYTSFYNNSSTEHYLEESFIGQKINNNFYWNYFDESTICSFLPYWVVPDSEFK